MADLPDALFDTLKNQVVFIADTFSRQTPEYLLDFSRINFLKLQYSPGSTDSFIVRLFVDPYRKKEKQVIEIKCGRNNCSANKFSFDETFDGKNYSRSEVKIEALRPPDDWRSFFDALIKNGLLELPNGDNSFNCANNTKDGVTYSIQSINFSGEKHCSDYNTEVYDTTCLAGKHFDNIVKRLQGFEAAVGVLNSYVRQLTNSIAPKVVGVPKRIAALHTNNGTQSIRIDLVK